MSKAIAISADDKKWRTENDLRSLIEAEEIRKDPARLKAAQALARDKAKEMQTVQGATGAQGAKK